MYLQNVYLVHIFRHIVNNAINVLGVIFVLRYYLIDWYQHIKGYCVSVTTMANDICRPWYCSHEYVSFLVMIDIGNIMTDAACGAGNAYPSSAPDFTSGFHRGSCCPVICVSFFHVIVLSFGFWVLIVPFVWLLDLTLELIDLRKLNIRFRSLTSDLIASTSQRACQVPIPPVCPLPGIILNEIHK